MTEVPVLPTITEELQRIEREEGVRILYACEAGSRAWGLASRNSDYDVRFLYVRPVDWYLSLYDRRDVIERPLGDRLDINGWDLKKALLLFRKSNPPLLEWLQSPIVYLERYTVTERIRELSPLTFSPRSGIYHYLHMAKRNFRDYLQGESVRIKKYLYVLRPVLVCEWIARYGTMPPASFGGLVSGTVAEPELRREIETLLARKQAGEELGSEPRLNAVHRYLERQLATLEETAKRSPAGGEGRDRELDELFRSALREVWGEAWK